MSSIADRDLGGGRPSPRRGRARLALVVLALAPALMALARIVEVSSLTLAPSEIAGGGTATGTVTLTQPAIGATQVLLTSSDPAVARVPTSVFVRGKTTSATFTVTAPAAAVGCPTISAKVGSTPPRSRLLFVKPAPSPQSTVSVEVPPNGLPGGASGTGTVGVLGTAAGSVTVQLSSSNPSATVPASVTVQVNATEGGVFVGSATFPITTTVVSPTTCSVITARVGTAQRRALLKLFTISG
jgi:trimeric autotransporter adhesin